MSRPAIEVRNVSKVYQLGSIGATSLKDELERIWDRVRGRAEAKRSGEFIAVNDVSFDVQPGEILGIIGRNGAGKSTLLKILSRITQQTSGEIVLRGRVASLLEVGMGFHPDLSGRENIFLNGAILGMTKAEIRKKLDEIVAFAEVEKFIDTPVKRYSSGMYVRLAFAVAAHLEPEILILDEVLAVGDARFQEKCLKKIRAVAGGGRTVIMVSHNMSAVRSLCDKACVLHQGKLIQKGDPEECAETYLGIYHPTSESGVVSFKRPEKETAWMKSARLYCGGQLGTQLEMGAPLSLEIDFESETEMEPGVGIVVNGPEGARLFHASTRNAPSASFRQPVKGGTIRCDFGEIPFTAGRYTISLWFGGRSYDTHCEDPCISFEVIEKDLWGCGRPYLPAHSILWWPAKIELKS